MEARKVSLGYVYDYEVAIGNKKQIHEVDQQTFIINSIENIYNNRISSIKEILKPMIPVHN